MRARVRACVCQHRCVPDSIYYHDQDAKSSYTVMIDSHIVLLCTHQLLFLTHTTQKLLDENTPIAYQKIINVGAYSIMLICMDVFILFVDDHRIALDEMCMEFS